MRWSERVAWGLVGVLLVAALAVPFLLSAVLGTVILVFSLGVVAWVYGVRKRHVEAALRALAVDTGMTVEPHLLAYAAVTGVYHGRPARVEIASGHDFGPGAVATVTTGVNLAAADIHNFTRIRVRPADPSPHRVPWPETPDADETVLDLPVVAADERDLLRGLDRALAGDAGRRES